MADAQLSTWLEREHTRGAQASAAIARQRRTLTSTSGLDRFATRMAMVELTGAIAGWAHGVHEGLVRAGRAEAAAFAVTPPFAAPAPTPEDYDRLDDYVRARVTVLAELLGADA